MGSVSEPQIPPLGGGVTPEMIDRLVGHREGAPPPLMQGADNSFFFQGLPFRGDPSLFLKKDDPQWRQPQLRYEVHVRVFTLDDKDQLEAYTEVCQQVANGRAMVSYEKLEYDKDRRTWQVLLRWMDVFFQGPDQKPARTDAPGKE